MTSSVPWRWGQHPRKKALPEQRWNVRLTGSHGPAEPRAQRQGMRPDHATFADYDLTRWSAALPQPARLPVRHRKLRGPAEGPRPGPLPAVQRQPSRGSSLGYGLLDNRDVGDGRRREPRGRTVVGRAGRRGERRHWCGEGLADLGLLVCCDDWVWSRTEEALRKNRTIYNYRSSLLWRIQKLWNQQRKGSRKKNT